MAESTADKPTVLVFSQSGIDGGLKLIKEKAAVHQACCSKPGEPAALLRACPGGSGQYERTTVALQGSAAGRGARTGAGGAAWRPRTAPRPCS